MDLDTDLGQLASVPQDMAYYGNRIADYVEKHTNHLAAEIRDMLESASWIPDSLRPPPGQSLHYFSHAPPPPQGIYDRVATSISRNRTAIAIIIAFAGTTVFLVHRRRKAHARKRRARKFANGAKKEIVVLACSSFHDPLTRSLALDLERRGYIVYVTVASKEEDSLVHAEAKEDLRPLWMDLTSSVPDPYAEIRPNLNSLKGLLTRASRSSSPGSVSSSIPPSSQTLILAGLVVLPGSTDYPSGPLVTLKPSEVIDTINTRMISPTLTIQQFLPLLSLQKDTARSQSSIILAYPSIPVSLSPPFQVPSLLTTSSLSALARSLRRESQMASLNITVTELRLGNFDLGSTYAYSANKSANARDLESQRNQHDPQSSALTYWHSSHRVDEARARFGQSPQGKGSAVREFHNAVFDALAPPQHFLAFGKYSFGSRQRPTTVFVGAGARFYDVVANILPENVVGWMMGYRPHPGRPPLEKNECEGIEARERWEAPSGIGSESGAWEKL